MPDLPRAFPNPGVWCWLNALLQALASISNPCWWEILDAGAETGGLLAAVSGALRWIGRHDVGKATSYSLMVRLAAALSDECGLTPAIEQDVHEALLKVLEAIHKTLLWREFRMGFKCSHVSLAPLPSLGRSLVALKASSLRDGFLDLWQGVFEERRVCCECGLVRLDRRPVSQAFRCLSLDLSPDLSTSLDSMYGGSSELIEGVLCSGCSLVASLRCLRYSAARGWPGAHVACQRLMHLKSDVDAESLKLLPLGSPPPTLRRTTHRRTLKILQSPKILALHLRRLMPSPCGYVKSDVLVSYQPFLLLGMVSLENKERARLYSLRAVVSHLGSQATGGHFMAHRRVTNHGDRGNWEVSHHCVPHGTSMPLMPSHWVLANDDHVVRIRLAQVFHNHAYLLLYER